MFQLSRAQLKATLAKALLVVFVFSAAAAQAASAPNVISYQGRVLNANGVPVTDTSISMIFELYTAVSGGSCVWSNSSATCASATSRSVTLTDGLFSESLGDTGSSYAAIGDSIFADNAALYLQVTIGGEVLSPRKQIVSAPYALNSDTLDGLDGDNDGSTAAAIVALNSSGNAVFTGNPSGSTVSTGSVYINPSSSDTAANDTILGIADGGTELFRIDKEGDVTFTGTTTFSAPAATTTALVITDTDYTNALSIGDNNIIGTTGAIDFTNFDVATTGAITVAAGTGLDTNGAGALNIGATNASTLNLCTGANCTAINIGTYADSAFIHIGDTSLNDSVEIYSDDWEIDVNGNFDTIGDIISTGDISFTLGTSETFTLTAGSTADSFINLTSTADFLFQDNSSTFLTLSDTGAFTYTLDATDDPAFLVTDNGTGGVTFDLNDASDFSVNLDGTGSIKVNNGVNEVVRIIGADGALASMILDSNQTGFGGALSVTGDGTTTGDVVTMAGDGLTSGSVLSLASSGDALTSGDLLDILNGGTRSSTGTISSSLATLTRDVANNSGGLLTLSGDLFEIVNTPTNLSGTLTDTADLLSLTQSNGSSSGAGIRLTQAGTGHGVLVANSGTGSSIFVDPSGNTGTTVSTSAGGAVHIDNTSNNNYGLTMYSNNGGTAASPLAYVYAANVNFNQDLVHLRKEGTGPAGTILLLNSDNGNTRAGATDGALYIDTAFSGASPIMTIESDDSSSDNIVFEIDANGDFQYDGTGSSPASDVAEVYPSNDALEPGDVVAFDATNAGGVRKTTSAYDAQLFGAVSTKPGLRLGDGTNGYDIALTGRIPLKVTTENGVIEIGDPLTSSSTPGYAMKATESGMILGYALEAHSAGSGTISAFMNTGWYGGDDVFATDGSITELDGSLALASLSTASVAAPASHSQSLTFRGSAWNGAAAETIAMSLSNKVTSVSDYKLSFTNTTGSEVAYINNVGDLVLSGRLYPSNQGVAQTSAYIYYDSSGVGYMRTNAAGWSTGSYDFAEMFPSPETLVPGDVVVFGDGAEQVKKSTGQTYDDRIAGVVSTRPGFLAGEYKAGDHPIALSGRVPTRVSNENGAIAVGDPLTTSSTPGVAMKATKPGPIVGYALEPMVGASGSIKVFIRASYYDGDGSALAAETTGPVSGVGTSDIASLNATGALTMNGYGITSIGALSGLGGMWSLNEQGDLVTRGRLVQVVQSHQGEDVPTYAAASRDMTIELSGTSILSGNVAIVQFETIDPKFNDIISTTAPYRVIATPSGVTGQIYVTDRSASGFTIRAEHADEGVLVDWMVIAYHKDYEPAAVTVPVATPEPEPEVAGAADEPVEPIVESSPEPETTEPEVVETPVEEPAAVETTPETVPEPEAPVAEPTTSGNPTESTE